MTEGPPESASQAAPLPPIRPVSARRGMKSSQRESLSAYLFASPWFIGFSVFLLYPLLASIYFSFCDYSVLRPPVWIGAANYTGLWHDEVFWTTLKNTGMLLPYRASPRPCRGAGAGAACSIPKLRAWRSTA